MEDPGLELVPDCGTQPSASSVGDSGGGTARFRRADPEQMASATLFGPMLDQSVDVFGTDAVSQNFSPLSMQRDLLGEPCDESEFFDDEPIRRGNSVLFSKEQYNKALFDARLDLLSDTQLKLPWEQGILKTIFDDSDESALPSVLPAIPDQLLTNAIGEQLASSSELKKDVSKLFSNQTHCCLCTLLQSKLMQTTMPLRKIVF